MNLPRFALIATLVIATNNFPHPLLDPSIDFLKKCSIVYFAAIGSTIVHELGHALSAKYFWDSPIDITIGLNEPEKLPLLKLPGMQFKSFNPILGGFARFKNLPSENNITNKFLYQKIIVCAAGPISGITSLVLASKFLNIKPSNDDTGNSLERAFGTLLLCELYNLFFTANQILNTTDSKQKSDGEHIYDSLRMLWERKNTNKTIAYTNLNA